MYELDLHDHTWEEALRKFVEAYNRHVQSGSREPMRIIHGYGSSGEGGKIRKKIRAFVESASASLDWKSGEALENNPGATLIYPRRALPSLQHHLAEGILAFCSIPRTESKIAAEFRQHSPRDIKQALRSLVRQARIKEIFRGGREIYVNAAFEDGPNQ